MKKMKSGLMIQDDPTSPDYCPRSVMEKPYPMNYVDGSDKMKDLYSGVQAALEKDRAKFRKESEGAEQFY